MSILDDSFSIELNHPLDEEAWKVIEDAELDNTEHIYFATPSDKRVEFIKADVLDKIRAEIDKKQYDFMDDKDYDEGIRFGLMLAYQIIDKYKAESEDKE